MLEISEAKKNLSIKKWLCIYLVRIQQQSNSAFKFTINLDAKRKFLSYLNILKS